MSKVAPAAHARRNSGLLALLESNPRAYKREIARLHKEEPDAFEAFVRAVVRGMNTGRTKPRWTLVRARAFVLGA